MSKIDAMTTDVEETDDADIKEIEAKAAKYRANTPLEERTLLVDKAAKTGVAPLTLAVFEALLIGDDAPWRHLPAGFRKARA